MSNPIDNDRSLPAFSVEPLLTTQKERLMRTGAIMSAAGLAIYIFNLPPTSANGPDISCFGSQTVHVNRGEGITQLVQNNTEFWILHPELREKGTIDSSDIQRVAIAVDQAWSANGRTTPLDDLTIHSSSLVTGDALSGTWTDEEVKLPEVCIKHNK